MRRSTAFLTAAALAIGAMSLPTVVVGQQQNTSDARDTAGADRSSRDSSGSARQRESAESGRHMDEVKGVQELFARASDAAVSENGITQLTALFATRQGSESREGQSGRRGETPDSASDRSATSGGAAAGRSRIGTAETAGSPRSNGTASETAGNFDSKQLDQIVQQIRQEWKQKYNQDFKITNESVVFSDITAADIGAREAQPAGGELRGTRSGASEGSRDLGGDTRGSGANGTASDRGSAYSRNDRTSSSASGAASSEGNGSAQHAGQREMGRPLTVNVPAVGGTEPVQVRLIRAGEQFKFASHGQIDQQKLGEAIEKHLREVQESQKNWPADVNQGYRLVTQHVLMAINDASGHRGESGDQVQPAGSRIRGTSDTSGSSGNDSSSGTRSNSNSTGTGSNQNR